MNYEPGKYVSTTDVALRWGVSGKTIQRLIQAGCLRAIKVGVKNYSVLSTSVDEYEHLKQVNVRN